MFLYIISPLLCIFSLGYFDLIVFWWFTLSCYSTHFIVVCIFIPTHYIHFGSDELLHSFNLVSVIFMPDCLLIGLLFAAVTSIYSHLIAWGIIAIGICVSNLFLCSIATDLNDRIAVCIFIFVSGNQLWCCLFIELSCWEWKSSTVVLASSAAIIAYEHPF